MGLRIPFVCWLERLKNIIFSPPRPWLIFCLNVISNSTCQPKMHLFRAPGIWHQGFPLKWDMPITLCAQTCACRIKVCVVGGASEKGLRWVFIWARGRKEKKKSKSPTFFFLLIFFSKIFLRFGPVIIKSLIFGLKLAIFLVTGRQRVALPQGGKDLEKLNFFI